jgi:hypothetical protein
MRLFGGGTERKTTLELIRHLQTMYAYQQLSMERYNDALLAAGIGSRGPELSHRVVEGAEIPNKVAEHLIPAFAEKDEVFGQIDKVHVAFGRPTSSQLRPAYDDFSRFLDAMRTRLVAQREAFNGWAADKDATAFLTPAEDLAEMRACDASITTLNALIAQIRLSPDNWLNINADAFNLVREWIGLSPLTRAEFREKYSQGQETGSARFFS